MVIMEAQHHHPPNLDHVVVRVRHGNRSVDFTLNSFVNDAGNAAAIRVSSHYDYKGIREFLRASIRLPSTEPLVFSQDWNVCSKHDLELLIISIQTGTTILPSLDRPLAPVPGLLLRSGSSVSTSRASQVGKMHPTVWIPKKKRQTATLTTQHHREPSRTPHRKPIRDTETLAQAMH
ncbi:uncharacterized protein F4822DRAFT_100563 [Hypoxylon trugodes]|uniref:uncharacterized protein n=1 Tax=Hypoxylon trugodes TaxID=326681 RepID=UPI002194742B|nr:uncharacterized protein F4822DRAFT_100563 [Hypoxylon trugodes]KAI1382610.1 hypothetical protein F4822DRAFT_100563 [Hypoxylon trugodes]